MQLDYIKSLSRSHRLLASACAVAALLLGAGPAAARLRVVTSTPSLAALALAVGGEDVAVKSLAPPTSDPHFVDGRPSYVVDLNGADLLIHVGLDLEVGWLPPLVANARNAKILPGASGNLDASTVAGPLLGVGRSTDRAQGDVHAGGDPHYLMDPRMGVNVALGIAQRLVTLDPEHADAYKHRAAAFKQAMTAHIANWQQRMAPHAGAPVVSFHDSTGYLVRWLKLQPAGHVEPLPGVAPTPGHLAQLILEMRRLKVRVVLSEAWYDAETTRVVAEKAGATVLRLPGDVGAPGIDSYPALIETLVAGLEHAL